MNKYDSKKFMADLRRLLVSGGANTQEHLCQQLVIQGHQVNQSKISRYLRKLNAVKSRNEQGEMVYQLPHDTAPPPIATHLSELIIDVVSNESMIIIKTSPGSAQIIARILDYHHSNIIGTIAGDDAIFVAPRSVTHIKESLASIKKQLDFE